MKIIFYCLLLITHSVLSAELESLEDYLSELKTFQADFTQTLLDLEGNIIDVSSGKMYLLNPGKFHWVYQQPYSQLIITDGKNLWIYDEDLQQVTIRTIDKEMDSTPAAVLSGREELEKHFTVEHQGIVEGINVFQLNPINPDSEFNTIRIGFHDQHLALLWLVDNLGQMTRIDFSEQYLNGSLDKQLFQFIPPEDIDVIDTRIKK